jgi:hypothetical protein
VSSDLEEVLLGWYRFLVEGKGSRFKGVSRKLPFWGNTIP